MNIPKAVKPVCVVGVSGSGKTTLLKHYQEKNPSSKCVHGSAIISEVIKPLSLSEFKKMPDDIKYNYRQKAIAFLRDNYDHNLLLVDGHLSFPKENSNEFENVFTESDYQFYGSLILLNPPANTILKRRLIDQTRLRCTSLEKLIKHQIYEQNIAQTVAYQNKMNFFIINDSDLFQSLNTLHQIVTEVLIK